MRNTIISILQFYKSVLRKYAPFKLKDNCVEAVVNHVGCNGGFSSSGQPTKQQLFLIRKAGYAVVINLTPNDWVEGPLKDEEEIVTKISMKYVHIPVNMLKPTQEDFDTFVNTMKSASNQKIWVHCAIGLRASAFIYRYRCAVLGHDEQSAIWDLRKIWEPFGAWKQFTFTQSNANQRKE